MQPNKMQHKNKFYTKYMKRLLDIIFSTILLFLITPLLLIIGLLIKFDSKGPIFYMQTRVGYMNHEFSIFKFRTMVQNAENIGPGFKTSENDTRITRIGKFLRKTSLDELPQILNIVKGDMSFIGPRPTIPKIVNHFDEQSQKRHLVLPGVTGLAQVNGRQSLEWQDKLIYDLEYVQKVSFLFDLIILISTIRIVINGKGVHKTNLSQEFKDL